MEKNRTLYISKGGDSEIVFVSFEDNLDDYIKLFTYQGGMEIAIKIGLEFLKDCRKQKVNNHSSKT